MKIHLGCGQRYIEGFIHVDIAPYPHLDCQCSAKALPFSDNVVDLLYTSHILEHYGRYEINRVLREWFRVLRPGGVLRLAVPDFAAVVEEYERHGLENGKSGLVGLVSGGAKKLLRLSQDDLR